ncbi:MAG: L-aspartate oxidase [Legionellaceae bacterium]|nr:L-aspartate oxidase [Legionellaceae bacterium]
MTNSNLAQRGQRHYVDALVIGSGLAGLLYTLELHARHPHAKIALISKKTLNASNSWHAQGGISSVTLQTDSFDQHIKDTLNAGDGLCVLHAVKKLLKAGPDAIQKLKTYGVQFDESLSKEGGHSERRIHHVGDYTGKAIVQCLINYLQQQHDIIMLENHTAVNLITAQNTHFPGSQNEVVGAYLLNNLSGKIDTCISKVVVLATGGAGKIYRYTSNPDTATGDGIAMAYRAGARIGNMEFYQFHPTVLHHHKLNNFLITEALRGEGAHLLHPETLERFMTNYDEKAELATRDVVARAIFTEIERSNKNFVYLDIRHQPREFLQQHFPSIFSTLLELGIDMSKDLIPVVPAAHYLCGGILSDIKGQTDLKRLYAIGETAFTGLHGANRLASNSLLEATAMASIAAEDSATYLEQPMPDDQDIEDWDSQSVIDLRRASQINAHWRGLRGEMTSYAGIVRTEAGLKDLLHLIQARREMIENYYWKYTVTTDLIELRNISLVAELIVRSALKRQESRGGHYREDFPKKSNRSKESILVGDPHQ